MRPCLAPEDASEVSGTIPKELMYEDRHMHNRCKVSNPKQEQLTLPRDGGSTGRK
jgi:hypothetical protein